MPSKHPTTRLGSIAKIIMGQSPPGNTYNEVGQGLPFYQGVVDFGSRYPSRRVYCSAPTRIAESDDIMFSVRAPIGRVNVAVERCAIGRGLAVVRPHDPKDQVFLEFVLRAGSTHLWSMFEGGGSVFGNARRDDLESLEVVWPPVEERRAIAAILGALDDKIELNRRMNETLEAMAGALFNSWFVGFEPFRDQGMEDSPLGAIPRGWRVGKLDETIELQYGKGLKDGDRRPGGIPVYGSNGQVGWHDEALVNGPGIVVGRKGNPGIVTWVPCDFYPIDTTFYVVPIGPIHSMYFLFHALQRLYLPSLGADSAVPGLNRNLAYMSDIIIPTPDSVGSFDTIAKPWRDKAYANEQESYALASIRDALLSKLLSGEIRVRDAEDFVEGMV